MDVQGMPLSSPDFIIAIRSHQLQFLLCNLCLQGCTLSAPFLFSLPSRVKFAVCAFGAANPVLLWGGVCDWGWVDAAFPGCFMALPRVFNSACISHYEKVNGLSYS